MPSSPGAEYLVRIHRVQDYIERNLDSNLPLEELARVANFSPFHFHRVYRAITGESLYQFILRVRLERAAGRLLADPREPVTNIALDCGFSSAAAFARAFRARFGVSAGEWRRDGNAASPPMREAATARAPAKSVRVEAVAVFTVAYVRHVGPYAGDGALFGRLFRSLAAWAGPRRLIGPRSRWISVYHDNPEITQPEKLRLSVCLSVPEGTAASGEVNTMQIPGGDYAKALFEIDPSGYGAAWDWVFGEWLPSSGCQPDERPCLENYLNNPDTHPENKHIVEIWVPVRPL